MMVKTFRHRMNDIENFDDLNNICFMVYEIENYIFILSQKSTYDFVQNDVVYLLKKDYYENADDLGDEYSHYVCIKQYILFKQKLEPYVIILRRTADTVRCVNRPYQMK